jgi:hypothetical protein
MAKRAITEKQRAWLAGELEAWQGEGLVSAEQSARLLGLYDSKAELAEKRHSKTLLILMSAAALLAGMGVLLLIGYNWQKMPAATKVLIIFGAITGIHALGLFLRYRRESRLGSEAAFFLGCLLYGAGIWLVAQIFNLNAHYPDGVWWWALGVLPFALALETPLLHALYAVLLGLWCSLEIIGFSNLNWWFWGWLTRFPNGAYSLPWLALPGLLWAYRRQSVATVWLYVPLLAYWVALQPLAWHDEWSMIYLIGTVGGLLLVASEGHAEGSPFAIPYRYCGTLLAGGVLALFSFHDFCKEFVEHGLRQTDLRLAALFPLLALAALGLLALLGIVGLVKNRVVATDLRSLVIAVLRRQWPGLGLVALMVIFHGFRLRQGHPLIPAILANLAMIVLAFWLMAVGLRESRGQPFAAGVLYFLFWAVIRYIDLFGNFGGMLGAALMFFLCGAALFGVAQFWRRRQKGKHG